MVPGILDTIEEPVLRIPSLPVTFPTSGQFPLVIHAPVLLVVPWPVSGFHVPGFGATAGGNRVISLASMLPVHAGQRGQSVFTRAHSHTVDFQIAILRLCSGVRRCNIPSWRHS